MNDKCYCGHYSNEHRQGQLEIRYGQFMHKIKETRLNCNNCTCPKYGKKRHGWDKFWNGSE